MKQADKLSPKGAKGDLSGAQLAPTLAGQPPTFPMGNSAPGPAYPAPPALPPLKPFRRPPGGKMT